LALIASPVLDRAMTTLQGDRGRLILDRSHVNPDGSEARRSCLDCCALTGLCVPATDPALCTLPPPGTTLPCRTNEQCPDGTYCAATHCGAVGGCTGTSVMCDGTLAPVCGCNGTSYTNPCWAQRAGTNVDHAGSCP
jgi:hypothetical protein